MPTVYLSAKQITHLLKIIVALGGAMMPLTLTLTIKIIVALGEMPGARTLI